MKDGQIDVLKTRMFEDFQQWCEKQPAHVKAGTVSQFVKALRRYGLEAQNYYFADYRATKYGYRHVNIDDVKTSIVAKDAWDKDAE